MEEDFSSLFVGKCSGHIWEQAMPDPQSDLASLVCEKCGIGISVPPGDVGSYLKRTEG